MMSDFVATNKHLTDGYTLGVKLAEEDAEKGYNGDFFWENDLGHDPQDILFSITSEKIDPDENDAVLILETVEDSYYLWFDNREDEIEVADLD
jgi:hypothetical protein